MHDLWSHLGGTLIERWTPKFIPRRFWRHRVCLEAVIRPLVMNRPMPCTVLDLSEGGAKLRVSFGALIPARFELAIPSRREHDRDVGPDRATGAASQPRFDCGLAEDRP